MHHVRTCVAALAVSVLALTACGSDEGSGVQDELVDEVLSGLEEFTGEETGIILDEDCVRDVLGDLSDEDAAEALETIDDPDADISEAVDAAGQRLESECLSFEE